VRWRSPRKHFSVGQAIAKGEGCCWSQVVANQQEFDWIETRGAY